MKCCDFHPTQPWVLCSLFNGKLQIWNYITGTLVQSITVSEKPVRSAKFVSRQNWIVAVSDDQNLHVLDERTGGHVTQFEAHLDFIRSVDVHGTLPLVLTSSDDETVKLWDWEKGWTCQVFTGHSHYVMQEAFNPKDPNMFASASLDGTVKIWDIPSKTVAGTLEGHTKGVNCLGFSHDDQPYLVSGSDDYTAKLWDLKTMSCIGTLTGHTDNITSVAFHPELPLILTASEDGTIRSWNIHTLSLEKTTDIGMGRAWSLSVLKGSNVVAAGFDKGTAIFRC